MTPTYATRRVTLIGMLVMATTFSSAAPFHLASGRYPAWSPDGARIAFDNHQLYTIATDGTDAKQLTSMPSNRNAWGAEYRPGTNQIYYMDNSLSGADFWWIVWTSTNGAAGRNTVQQVPGGDTFTHARFSPSGNDYCYRHLDTTGPEALKIARFDGTSIRTILTLEGLGPVTWGSGANGDKLGYTKPTVDGIKSVFIITTNGLGETRITGTDIGNVDDWVNWSPDGQSLLFSAQSDIWSINIADGRLSRLTVDSYADSYAVISPDGQTLAYTSVRNGTEELFLIDYAPDQEPPSTEQLVLSILDPKSPTATGAIFITHGRNNSVNSWPADAAARILAQLQSTGNSADWDVIAYDWASSATGAGDINEQFEGVRENAQQLGLVVGALLNQRGYQNIHFIAHSAGCWLIENAAARIDSSKQVQMTFLDAYTPFGAIGVNSASGEYALGEHADYAEHYFSVDVIGPDFPGIDSTESCLSEASNINITDLHDSDIGPSGHGWPVSWYLATITDPTASFAHGYGFGRSWEGGGSPLPKDGSCLTLPEPAAVIDRLYVSTPAFAPGSGLDNLNTWMSDPSDVTVFPSYFLFEQSSPLPELNHHVSLSSSDSVVTSSWISFYIPVTQTCNQIGFTLEFGEAVGSENVLSVNWSGINIATIDERYFDAGPQAMSLMLPDIYSPGLYNISFRLDSYALPKSSALVSNITFAFVAAASAPAIDISSSATNTVGISKIEFPSMKGFAYFCQQSSNLVNWTTFATNLPGNGGLLGVTITNASTTPRKFIRSGVQWRN